MYSVSWAFSTVKADIFKTKSHAVISMLP